MKTLNGKLYFEKEDVKNVINLALSVVDNPYDNQDFLLIIHDDERSVVKNSIQSLGNSLNWEFVTETALNYDKIEEISITLQFPASETLTHTNLQLLQLDKITKNDMKKYENWLVNVGLEISINEFKKINK
tara:strand:- start:382 stop:774 length:393 start_codon:yes stop_codon:yes gene_type:complete